VSRHIWVDKVGARRGAILVVVGLALLLGTLWLGIGDSSTPDCSSLNDPDRARECVSSGAQGIERGSSAIIGIVALSLALVAFGGALVFRARRRVVDLAEAAAWLDTDVLSIRSLIAEGDLASLTSEGRTFVDVGALEVRAAPKMGAVPNG
jgi:hypothetical protein